jgi:hypothetical protein
MQKAVYYTSLITSTTLLAYALYLFLLGYSSERVVGILLMVPTVSTLLILSMGPDIEERILARRLNKARMRKELQDLEGNRTERR